MEFYLLFLTFIIFTMIIPNKKYFFIINFFIMGIFAGLRSIDVGTDTRMYHNIYYTVRNIPFEWVYIDDSTRIEIGHRVLMTILSNFSIDGQIYIFVTSIITFSLFGKFLYDNTDYDNYKIPVFLFFAFGYFIECCNTVRQMLAVAMALNGITMFAKKKYILGVIIFVGSLLFHASNVLLVLCILFSFGYIRFFCKKSFVFPLTVFLLFVFFSIGYLDVILEFFLSTLGEKYQYYLFSTYANEAGLSIIKILSTCTILLWSMWYKYTDSDRLLVGVFFVLLIADIGCLLLSSSFLGIFYRFHFAFFCAACPFVSLMLKYTKNLYKFWLYPMFVILGYISLYRLFFVANDIEFSFCF